MLRFGVPAAGRYQPVMGNWFHGFSVSESEDVVQELGGCVRKDSKVDLHGDEALYAHSPAHGL